MENASQVKCGRVYMSCGGHSLTMKSMCERWIKFHRQMCTRIHERLTMYRLHLFLFYAIWKWKQVEFARYINRLRLCRHRQRFCIGSCATCNLFNWSVKHNRITRNEAIEKLDLNTYDRTPMTKLCLPSPFIHIHSYVPRLFIHKFGVRLYSIHEFIFLSIFRHIHTLAPSQHLCIYYIAYISRRWIHWTQWIRFGHF